jgi:hypothetical protein
MYPHMPIPVVTRSKAWVCGRSLTGNVGSNPAGGGHGCLSLVSVVCCQVEVSASAWLLVHRSPTECGVSECDREAPIMRRPWPTKGCCAMEKSTLIKLRLRKLFFLIVLRTYRYLKLKEKVGTVVFVIPYCIISPIIRCLKLSNIRCSHTVCTKSVTTLKCCLVSLTMLAKFTE